MVISGLQSKMLDMEDFEIYAKAFIEGYVCATIGERITTAKVSESELDNAKRAAEKYIDFQIDHSDLSTEEKDAKKKNYKLRAESTLQGMKSRLRESGRLLGETY